MKIISLIFCSIKNVPHICNMINANVHSEHAQGETNASGETGAQLRMRMGANERAFQSRWKRNFGYAFNARRICTPDEVLQVEALYSGNIVRPLRERVANEACDNNKVENPSPNVGAGFLETETVKAVKAINYRRLSLFAAFAAPTIASISTTYMVSHAMSGNSVTSMAITAVASTTSLLFLWAGVRSVGSIAVVLLTLGFEGFCNAASVFKWLMGDLAYSLTTVSGKPTEFLAMVANFTGKDHQDVATWMAIITAGMICSAQVSSLYELKK